MGSEPSTPDGTDPAGGDDRPARDPGLDQADGCPAHGRLGVGHDPGSAVAADDRAGPGADRVLTVRAGGVRPTAGRQGADRAGPVARPRRGVPVPAQRGAAGRRHGPGARCVLRRRLRARLQRLDVHRPGRDLDPLGHRVGGDGGDRDDEGAAPRRCTVRGRRPAEPGRVARARRGMGPRRARPRRAADGLRSPRLPRLRPAGRRAPQGRRGDGATAPSGSSSPSRSRTSSCASWPRSTPSERSRPTSSSTPRPS